MNILMMDDNKNYRCDECFTITDNIYRVDLAASYSVLCTDCLKTLTRAFNIHFRDLDKNTCKLQQKKV